MNHTTLSRRSAHRAFPLAVSLMLCAAGVGHAAAPTPPDAEALLYSTMPSTAAHSPQMALDGDPNTYYKTVYGMGDGDDFLVLLSRPIPVTSLRIQTGDTDGGDLLTDGFVETSPDGVHFSKAAAFDSTGVASAALKGKPVDALRIKLDNNGGLPSLVIREIGIDSPVKISHVQWGPGRGFVDISQAPDLAVWSQKAEAQMEAFWPDTAALLYTANFITPNMVNVVYRTGPNVTGVAATGGGVMTVNSAWCRAHPDDTGLTVHETAHVIQAMSAYDPVWLIEGTADYIRWVKFEPQNFTYHIDPVKSTYHDSYRTTAAFLGWCELHYDNRLVTKLNQDTRYGTFKLDLFKKYCGKDVDTLWAEFVAAYQADPKGVLVAPVPPADKPRTLPTVADGSSVPVNLATAFNATGIVQDGATFAETDGADGGGAAYSAALLGATQTAKGVTFTLGPAGAPDVVSCRGQVIVLPAGSHKSLWLLGTAIDGNQKAQVFRVTYTDGTTQDLYQNLSDWFGPQDFPGETRAVKSAYRDMGDGTKDPRTFFAYSYGFALDPGKTVQSLTLPTDDNVKLLAVSLAD